MRKLLWYVLCVVLVVAMVGVGLFSALMNFKILDAAWDWIEDRFSAKGEASSSVSIFEHLASNVLCSRHLLQISDYSKSIPEYVKGLTGLQNCTMKHINELDSETQCYYKLYLNNEFVYVAFMGDADAVTSMVFFCDIDDNLRENQNYQGLVLALPFMCSDMINANGGSISEVQQLNMSMQVVEYFSEGNTGNRFTYSKDDFALDISFDPSDDPKSIYDGTMCIWFDIA